LAKDLNRSSSGKPPALFDPRLARALGHPIRVSALGVLRAREASPKQIADELGEDVSLVSYHVKELEKLGFIELVETRQRRGAVEHFYRGTGVRLVEAEDWSRVPAEDRPRVTMSILGQVSRDLTEAMESSTLDEIADNHISRTPLSLDRKGWEEVVTLLSGTLGELIEIQSRATRRSASSGEEPILTKVEMLHFKSPMH
jgi:DNA-binding transcriptional ArsR family regulator